MELDHTDDSDSNEQLNKLDDGSVFLDRNPKAFQLMLDYLRAQDKD